MSYNQYPYVIKFKDHSLYFKAYTWLLNHRHNGLWTPDYSQPNALKFTLEEDAVIVGLKFQ